MESETVGSAGTTVRSEASAKSLGQWTCRKGYLAQVALLGVLAAQMVLSQRYLFADGVFFHWRLMEFRSVFQWFPARRFSHLLTQWPTIAVMQWFDCHDMRLLSTIYGATQFLVPVAGLLAVAWAGRAAPSHFLLMPLLSASILTMTTSFVVFHESWVTIALFWLILHLLLFSVRMTWLRGIVLIAASTLVTRTYESFLFLSLPLFVAAALRARSAWRRRERWDAACCSASAVLAVVGAAISLREFLHPFDPQNRENFLIAVGQHLKYPPVWLTLGILLAFMLLTLGPSRLAGGRAATIFLTFLGICSLLQGLVPFIVPCQIEPELQYVSRPQFLYVPFALGVLSIGLARWPDQFAPPSKEKRRKLEALAALMTVSAFLFQWGATMEWNRFRKAVLAEVEPARGVLAYEDSILNAENVARESSPALSPCKQRFQWSWTTPVFTAYSSALEHGRVRTVIANRAGLSWEPFDPHLMEPYAWMRNYGIVVEIPDGKPLSEPNRHGM